MADPAKLVAQARAAVEGVTDGPWHLDLVGFRRRDAEFISDSRTLVPALANALEAALTERDALQEKADDRTAKGIVWIANIYNRIWDEGHAAATAAALLAAETAVDEYNREVGCDHVERIETSEFGDFTVRRWICPKCNQGWKEPR